MNTAPLIWVFFYGSYINLSVLKEVNLIPPRVEVARIMGFDIVIRPRANMVRSEQHIVCGIIAQATHAELERLYVDHAKGLLGEIYLPEAVLALKSDGTWLPVMTYICAEMVPRQADYDYVERIAKPAREFGFPADYVARIESFKS